MSQKAGLNKCFALYQALVDLKQQQQQQQQKTQKTKQLSRSYLFWGEEHFFTVTFSKHHLHSKPS